MTTEDHPNQTQIIQQIHADFRNSQNRTIESLNNEINNLSGLKELENQINCAEKLRKLGFIQAKGTELKKSDLEKRKKELEERQLLVNTIMGYSVKYPNYKFISDSEVRALCLKYNLVFGSIYRYKGEIPQKNLLEILRFQEIIDKDDIPKGKQIARNLVSLLPKDEIIRIHRDLEANDYKKGTYSSVSMTYEEGFIPMKICAPIKWMDTENTKLFDSYKIETTILPHQEDPILLQPVHEGYLIVTAWGDEANDQLVVNPILN